MRSGGGPAIRESPASTTVAVRLRPLNAQERSRGAAVCAKVDASGSQVRLIRSGSALGSLRFSFDHVYDGAATQHAIYEDLGRPLVKHAFRGRTCVFFAHGATGAHSVKQAYTYICEA